MTPQRVKQAIDALGVSQDVLASSSGGEMVGMPAGGSVEKAIPHVTPEQRGAVSGDSGTAAAFLDFLEYCRDNNIQGRLKKGATYYLAPDSFTLGDGQRLDLTSEDVAGDRMSVVEGKSVSVRVDLGGRRIIKKKTQE